MINPCCCCPGFHVPLTLLLVFREHAPGLQVKQAESCLGGAVNATSEGEKSE